MINQFNPIATERPNMQASSINKRPEEAKRARPYRFNRYQG